MPARAASSRTALTTTALRGAARSGSGSLEEAAAVAGTSSETSVAEALTADAAVESLEAAPSASAGEVAIKVIASAMAVRFSGKSMRRGSRFHAPAPSTVRIRAGGYVTAGLASKCSKQRPRARTWTAGGARSPLKRGRRRAGVVAEGRGGDGRGCAGGGAATPAGSLEKARLQVPAGRWGPVWARSRPRP